MQRLAAFAGTYKTGSSRPRRKMSAAARARIFAAQKARWAKAKGQKVVPIKAGKRRISPAGLARVRGAARARWPKVRGERSKPPRRKASEKKRTFCWGLVTAQSLLRSVSRLRRARLPSPYDAIVKRPLFH